MVDASPAHNVPDHLVQAEGTFQRELDGTHDEVPSVGVAGGPQRRSDPSTVDYQALREQMRAEILQEFQQKEIEEQKRKKAFDEAVHHYEEQLQNEVGRSLQKVEEETRFLTEAFRTIPTSQLDAIVARPRTKEAADEISKLMQKLMPTSSQVVASVRLSQEEVRNDSHLKKYV